MVTIPKHLKKLKSFIAMDLVAQTDKWRRAGKDVISFGVGEPDLDPPTCVEKALIEAVRNKFTKYTPSEGLLELREAVADHYREKYGVTVSPDRILITEGTSPAMLLAFAVLLSPGDEVVLSNPHYPCYPAFVQFLHGKPAYVRTHEEDGFQYRPEEIRKKISRRTRAILINSPSNPAGNLLSAEAMRKIACLGPWVVADEVYHGLVYEGRERSILEFTDHAFVLNGFSKAYAMTGYRLGYLIAPSEFIPILRIMLQNFYISASSFVQRAGIVALKEGKTEQEKMRCLFAERRQVMLEGVRTLGFGVKLPPTGAFYVFANAKPFTRDSYKFSYDLLEKAHVAVTPGIDFGSAGEGYLRFSYATSIERIREGLERIGRYLNSMNSHSPISL